MSKYISIGLLGLTLAVVLAAGCTDRGTNEIDRTFSRGGIWDKDHDFYDELKLQIGRNVAGTRVVMLLRGYMPEVSIPPISGGKPTPVPLLILLAPQDGAEYYYLNHGLKELADELIGEGLIEPMAVLCVPSDRVFGGYLYAGNSAPAGYYDYLIGGSLIDFIYSEHDQVTDSLPLGIGGVGMGGYGAFRAAILNPGRFTSICVTDGPYDFDGPDGNGGLVPLFSEALNEQGLLGGYSHPDTSWRQKFDTANVWPLSRLFVGGALAFSPNDTFIDTNGVIYVTGAPPNDELVVNIPDSQRFQLGDSVTLITEIVKSNQSDFDFHLPFDSTGNAYPLIWNMWLDDNLESLLSANPGALDTVKTRVVTTDEYAFGNYRQQTLSWLQTLSDNGVPWDSVGYSGYPGNPATSHQYIYDLMREMLIFHSRAFEEARSK